MLLPMPQTWLIKGRRAEDEMYRSMWEHAMDDMIARLVLRNNASGLAYVANVSPCALSLQLSAVPASASPPVSLRMRSIALH